MPESITHAILIADTGAATSMPNHKDQCKEGTIREAQANVVGAGGKFNCNKRATMRLPIDTSHGVSHLDAPAATHDY